MPTQHLDVGFLKHERSQVFALYCHELLHTVLLGIQRGQQGAISLSDYRQELIEISNWDEKRCRDIIERAKGTFADFDTLFGDVIRLYVAEVHEKKRVGAASVPPPHLLVKALLIHASTKQPVAMMKFPDNCEDAVFATKVALRLALHDICRDLPLEDIEPAVAATIFSNAAGAAVPFRREDQASVVASRQGEPFNDNVTHFLARKAEKESGKEPGKTKRQPTHISVGTHATSRSNAGTRATSRSNTGTRATSRSKSGTRVSTQSNSGTRATSRSTVAGSRVSSMDGSRATSSTVTGTQVSEMGSTVAGSRATGFGSTVAGTRATGTTSASHVSRSSSRPTSAPAPKHKSRDEGKPPRSKRGTR